jgi:alpha-glucosidase (family GH31 glycosyl hydrolase)
VIADYQKLLGKSILPPFWALGWQDASNNGTTEGLKEQVQGYYFQGLPLETVYLDRSSYNRSLNFVLDETKIGNIKEAKERLDAINVKLVGYLDHYINRPPIVNDSDYLQILYRAGNENNLFIKSIKFNESKKGDNLVGVQDQKMVVYLDWFNGKTTLQYW